tara:strand:- start:473 stop:1729 length:1257 start_codon:yes stop_codon:yes gene_type:complete
MKKIKTSISILLILIIYSSPALSKEINGSATYNYTSIGEYELNKEVIRSNAMRLACKNAFRKYTREFGASMLNNYEAMKSEIENNLYDYIECDLVVDEQNNKDIQSLTIVVKTIILTTKVEEKINKASKNAKALEFYVTSLMLVRKATGMDQKFDRVRSVNRETNTNTINKSSDQNNDSDASFSKQGNKSVNTDQIEAIDDTSVISSSNTDTSESGDFKGNTSQRSDSSETTTSIDTNINESGGGRKVSAAKYSYELDGTLERGLMNTLSSEFVRNGFDFVGSSDIQSEGYAQLYKDVRQYYAQNNEYDDSLLKQVKDALKQDEIDCVLTGSFDVGITERSPATGGIIKNVIVNEASLTCFIAKKGKTRKRWTKLATLGVTQAKGEGTDEREAETNAVSKAAMKVSKLLLNEVNAREF